MTTHSPTPWTTTNPGYVTTFYDVFDASGNLVANCGGWSRSGMLDQDEVKKANAALIVQAVNSHEEIRLWECPNCGFGFNATHTNPDGGYSCPACAEDKLQEVINLLLEAAKAALDAIKQEFLYQTGQTVRPGWQYPPQGTVCSALADVVQQLRDAIAAVEKKGAR